MPFQVPLRRDHWYSGPGRRYDARGSMSDAYVFPGGRADQPDRDMADRVRGVSDTPAREVLPNVERDGVRRLVIAPEAGYPTTADALGEAGR